SRPRRSAGRSQPTTSHRRGPRSSPYAPSSTRFVCLGSDNSGVEDTISVQTFRSRHVADTLVAMDDAVSASVSRWRRLADVAVRFRDEIAVHKTWWRVEHTAPPRQPEQMPLRDGLHDHAEFAVFNGVILATVVVAAATMFRRRR